jgi:hypothetical protein
MQHSLNHLFNFRKSSKPFSYTIFPVKKINVGNVLKFWGNHCLIILSDSHPEIGNFRV